MGSMSDLKELVCQGSQLGRISTLMEGGGQPIAGASGKINTLMEAGSLMRQFYLYDDKFWRFSL